MTERPLSPAPAPDRQGALLGRLLRHAPGRALLRVLARPWASRLAGRLLDSRPSRLFIRPFAKKHGIDLAAFAGTRFASFNAFFCRPFPPQSRPFDPNPDVLPAPCDARVTLCPIMPERVFCVKGVQYTLAELVRDPDLAARFAGGTLVLLRLCVDDYHRYFWPFDGVAAPGKRLPGFFYSVNPRMAQARPIYRENTREYTLVRTERFGTALLMEVGALFVGRIVNHFVPGPVFRGSEKGRFEFGGSTVILCFEKDAVRFDSALWERSRAGAETPVKMGERLGTRL